MVEMDSWCPSCGYSVEPSTRFCGGCGYQLGPGGDASPGGSTVTVAVPAPFHGYPPPGPAAPMSAPVAAPLGQPAALPAAAGPGSPGPAAFAGSRPLRSRPPAQPGAPFRRRQRSRCRTRWTGCCARRACSRTRSRVPASCATAGRTGCAPGRQYLQGYPEAQHTAGRPVPAGSPVSPGPGYPQEYRRVPAARTAAGRGVAPTGVIPAPTGGIPAAPTGGLAAAPSTGRRPVPAGCPVPAGAGRTRDRSTPTASTAVGRPYGQEGFPPGPYGPGGQYGPDGMPLSGGTASPAPGPGSRSAAQGQAGGCRWPWAAAWR